MAANEASVTTRAQEAERQRQRCLHEQLQIVGDPLVGVVASVLAQLEVVIHVSSEPFSEVSIGEPAPPANLQHLRQVRLVDRDDDEGGCQHAEIRELVREAGEVALLHQGLPLQAIEEVADCREVDGQDARQAGTFHPRTHIEFGHRRKLRATQQPMTRSCPARSSPPSLHGQYHAILCPNSIFRDLRSGSRLYFRQGPESHASLHAVGLIDRATRASAFVPGRVCFKRQNRGHMRSKSRRHRNLRFATRAIAQRRWCSTGAALARIVISPVNLSAAPCLPARMRSRRTSSGPSRYRAAATILRPRSFELVPGPVVTVRIAPWWPLGRPATEAAGGPPVWDCPSEATT